MYDEKGNRKVDPETGQPVTPEGEAGGDTEVVEDSSGE
jgi:hypothetical protein